MESDTVIMVELTCPCEENIEARNREKLAKYTTLVADCQIANWKVHLFAVEVGARGYAAQSLTTCLRLLGLKGRPLRTCVEAAGDEALRTSFWLWFLKENEVWEKVGFEQRKKKQKRRQVAEATE